jgi:hypothetical protein
MVEKHNGLAAALVAFQAEMPTVRKENTAKVTSQKGSYSYDYADLTDLTEAAMPILAKHGLSFASSPTMTENGFVLAYRLRHESGEEDAGEYPLPDPVHTPAQTIGSAITYARRYAMCAVTGLAPGGDDDDGEKAQDGRAAPRRQPIPTLSDADRIRKAAGALRGAQSAEAVAKVWVDIEKSRLHEAPELVAIHDDLVHTFSGDGSQWEPSDG